MQIGDRETVIGSLEISDKGFSFRSETAAVLETAELDLGIIRERIAENSDTIAALTPECDMLDYVLAVSSGVVCGMIDVFLVGFPEDSKLGAVTDGFFDNAVTSFAKRCGWKTKDGGRTDVKSAIGFLERKFGVPYDQTSVGGAARSVFSLSTRDHHYKSLGHNPNIAGLVFSIIDQFSNSSHFVSDGNLFELAGADGGFSLGGNCVPAKLWAAVVNWFGHLLSDVAGSSGCRGRGMGLPAPFMNWINDMIALKAALGISSSDFEKNLNAVAMNIYKKGFDVRFTAAQTIPVLMNEALTRLCFSVRRMFLYLKNTSAGDRSFPVLWKTCEPFSNATVKRMLTASHGTFCLLDISGAAVKGSLTGNGAGFLMCLNVPGLERFAVSLFGEGRRSFLRHRVETDNASLIEESRILEEYISGLKALSAYYDDGMLLTFVDDLKKSSAYREALGKTVSLAEKRGVSGDRILRTVDDIDRYFNNRGEKK